MINEVEGNYFFSMEEGIPCDTRSQEALKTWMQKEAARRERDGRLLTLDEAAAAKDEEYKPRCMPPPKECIFLCVNKDTGNYHYVQEMNLNTVIARLRTRFHFVLPIYDRYPFQARPQKRYPFQARPERWNKCTNVSCLVGARFYGRKGEVGRSFFDLGGYRLCYDKRCLDINVEDWESAGIKDFPEHVTGCMDLATCMGPIHVIPPKMMNK